MYANRYAHSPRGSLACLRRGRESGSRRLLAVSGRGSGFRALRGLGQACLDLFGLRCGLLGLLGLQLGGRDGGGGHLGPAGGERAAQKDQESAAVQAQGVMRNSVEKSGVDCVADFCYFFNSCLRNQGKRYRVFWCISPARRAPCGVQCSRGRSAAVAPTPAWVCVQSATGPRHILATQGVQGLGRRGGLLHIHRSFHSILLTKELRLCNSSALC